MKALRGLEKFSGGGGGGGGGPQRDYSVCPRPLRRVFGFSGFWFRVFRFLRFSGFQVSQVFGFRFSGLRFRVFRFFGRDGTGRGARQFFVQILTFLIQRS